VTNFSFTGISVLHALYRYVCKLRVPSLCCIINQRIQSRINDCSSALFADSSPSEDRRAGTRDRGPPRTFEHARALVPHAGIEHRRTFRRVDVCGEMRFLKCVLGGCHVGRCPKHARCCRLDPGFRGSDFGEGHSKRWVEDLGQVLASVDSVIFADRFLLVETLGTGIGGTLGGDAFRDAHGGTSMEAVGK
jgi:hypothetical protein